MFVFHICVIAFSESELCNMSVSVLLETVLSCMWLFEDVTKTLCQKRSPVVRQRQKAVSSEYQHPHQFLK